MKRSHELFKEAGMPEDRIDYILEKWAKFATEHQKPSGDDWRACKAAKTRCMKDGEKVTDGRCGWVWNKCAEEMKDHSGPVDKKDCYFDEACHKLVDWEKIGKVKQGIMTRMKKDCYFDEACHKLVDWEKI